jgi:hypothetical protein
MRSSDSTKQWLIGGGAVAAVVIVVGLYFYLAREQAAPPATETAPAETQALEPQSQPHYPVPETTPSPEEAPLPAIDDSDPAVLDELVRVFGEGASEVLVPDSIVRRVVATVDGMSRPKLALRMRPVVPVKGTLVVEERDGTTFLGEQNYARYAPFVQLVQAADTSQLVSLYYRFYPRFQQAYEQLGYPDAYFNDRVVAAIDDLLAAPDPKEPPALTRPKVYYEFADPDLESRSVGQKVLLRMGPENATIIRQKLRDLRREITSHVPQG